MPIKAYLDGHKFDAETVRLLGIAFEMALATLRPPPTAPIRFVRWSLERSSSLGKPASRDPERLCEGALNDLGPAVSVPNPPPPPAAPRASPGSWT